MKLIQKTTLIQKTKLLCTASALTCLLAFPSLAAETRAEYREAAAPIQSEIQTVNEELAKLREENTACREAYDTFRQTWKEQRTLSIRDEDWEQARELRRKIKEVRATHSSDSPKDQTASIKEAVQRGDYDAALTEKNHLLETKKTTLKNLQEINAIWKQIDELLK